MRILISIAIYVIFLIPLGIYIKERTKFKAVETWPSVPANILRSGGAVRSTPAHSRTGPYSFALDTRYVEFQYVVAGENFTQRNVTPDGTSQHFFAVDTASPRAYYSPQDPATAVLIPVPFQGTKLLTIAIFSGPLAAFHLWFSVRGLRERKRRVR